MGALSGSVPWYTMMVLHKKSAILQKVDDTLGAFHTHAVAGVLGGVLSGFLAEPNLLKLYYSSDNYGPGIVYGILHGHIKDSLRQMSYQIIGAVFITVWNVVVTSFICILISRIVNLRMNEEDLEIGDDAVHGEEAYALWGDGERHPPFHKPKIPAFFRRH